jgi:hypothetical protein
MLRFKSNRVHFYNTTLHNFLNTNKSRDKITLWSEIERSLTRGVLRAKSEVGVRTGRLKNSIFSYHLGHAGGQVYGIRAIAPYALIHHEGSRAHKMEIIRPSGKSRVLVSRTIMHPGTKPNPYLRNQLDTICRVGRGF